MSGSIAKLALQECLSRGVREFVVCAGARNAALVLALARTEGVQVWSHFEERGAGFFALGRVVAEKCPVAVVTTSGTAAAELLPAVIEAHYQGRPLIAVTADRPATFRGTGAPQAVEQVGLFGKYVEGCDDLGGALSRHDELFDGWSALRPWHLNVCLEEDAAVPELNVPAKRPEPPPPKRPGVVELVEFLDRDLFRGLVVLLGGLEPEEREDAFHFVKSLGVPVVADATSGLRERLGGRVLIEADALLRRQPPGKVLRLGDVPVGRFWRDLESLPEVDVLSITRTGFPGLARPSLVIEGRVHDVVKGLGAAPAIGDVLDLNRSVGRQSARLDELLERFPDSEPSLMRVLSTFATMGASVFLGNSLPIREWNLCAQRSVPIADVRASRGANGIDGQLSTWLGTSANVDGAWGVFGDLTVLYDLGAPALLAQVRGAGRVMVVINNRGGRIFQRLPRLAGLTPAESALVANAHGLGFAEWAAMWNMNYALISGREEFELNPGDRPLVVELLPNDEQTERFWHEWEETR